jgi:DNA-binding NtrC family response regulator
VTVELRKHTLFMSLQNEYILIVEDSPTLALTYREYLRPLAVQTDIAETGAEAIEKIHERAPTLILLDLKLPDMDGIDILKQLASEKISSRVVVVTAHGSVAVAVEAMREGASDFLLKPFTAERLTTTVNTALEISRLSNIVERIGQGPRKQLGSFIGDSPVMQAVYRMIEDAAPSRASVFIMGPSGTGKELCAESVHQLSPRSRKRFIALNCAAIPENLMESEIFGHVKGAFTGATSDRKGAAVLADGGTLFLDELCEMPLDLQTKLLRFIQTGQVVPVGSNQPVQVDVRFVCATNRIPVEEVAAGRFREDLFYRLHVIPIHMPPLKDRGEDVLAIAQNLLTRFAAEEGKHFEGFSDDAQSRLMAHNWPGNVRELGNVIQSTVVLNDEQTVTANMLSPILGSFPTIPKRSQSQMAAPAMMTSPYTPTISAPPSPQPPQPHDIVGQDIEPLATTERRAIEHAIRLSGGKVRAAAKALKVNPSTLYRKLSEWNEAKP